ncbi:hypothetical protein [Zhihengliuella halotolerans]|uniref:Uncharacterized protein n=1 Tax=Zhihengliuella halotolerans TaxID=370736 RepID=A0A4Q8AFI2_9MICC|nr:hypothetical protein [Zhihengliuella halotolerans]RZU62984.1 hypothetical protein EV380_2590 [Zhihengliuella halotolerans]
MEPKSGRFVRFEGPHHRDPGRTVGIFALANGLGLSGRLSAGDHDWWRAANDFGNAAYVDPETAAPGVYANHPSAKAWFKTSAAHLVSYTSSYLVLLRRYDVECAVRFCDDPGRILYEDAVQVIAVPS